MPNNKMLAGIAAAPLVAWMLVLLGAPLVYTMFLSFMTRGEHGTVEYILTLENYVRIFDPLFMGIITRSLGIAVITSISTLLVGYPFAFCLARLGVRQKAVVLLLLLVPFISSSLMRTRGWMLLLQTQGIVNRGLLSLGLIQEPLQLMFNNTAVLVVTVYMFLPFMTIPIFNSIDKLDWSLVQASRDLGAGSFSTFTKIILPLTVPGIAAGLTLVFIPSTGIYFIADLIGGGRTMLYGNLIANQLGSAMNRPFAAALAVVMASIIVLFATAYLKISQHYATLRK